VIGTRSERSGLVALTDAAIRHHSGQIRASGWRKLYLACLHVSQRKSLNDPLGAHGARCCRMARPAKVVRSGGKPARLEALAAHPPPQTKEQAHAVIRLATGRSHQIRATMAERKAPLVGDG
jgi:23S rRNA-/tRNA-specific pseudouridylate synthase